MGGGPAKDKKFVNKIMNQISSGKKVLNIVNDKRWDPAYTHDFAKTVKTLIENEYWVYTTAYVEARPVELR